MMFATSLSRVFTKSMIHHNNGGLMSCRNLTMHTINKNLYLCTDKPRKIEVDKKSLRFTQKKENTKPLVVMISWFYGQPSQINKYSKLYTDQGMDVLVGRISLVQFLISVKRMEQLGQDIVDVLNENKKDYPEIFIHTFSAGGGMWAISQRMMKRDWEKYGNIPKRVIGHIWDSVAHAEKTIVAIPFALFPKNVVMRTLFAAVLSLHLKLYGALQRSFDNGIENWFANEVRAPALLFASKVDRIGTVKFMEQYAAAWRANGMDVTTKVFEDSPHIKHFLTYPEEYLKHVHNHWEKTKLLKRE